VPIRVDDFAHRHQPSPRDAQGHYILLGPPLTPIVFDRVGIIYLRRHCTPKLAGCSFVSAKSFDFDTGLTDRGRFSINESVHLVLGRIADAICVQSHNRMLLTKCVQADSEFSLCTYPPHVLRTIVIPSMVAFQNSMGSFSSPVVQCGHLDGHQPLFSV